jgi:DNA-binding XRE family transcriptional regulator
VLPPIYIWEKLGCTPVAGGVSLLREVIDMASVRISTQEPSLAAQAKKLRLSCLLTQEELAQAAGVSREEVNRLEQGLPLILNSKRKILKELWARKAEK